MNSILILCFVILSILFIPLISRRKIFSLKNVEVPIEQGVKFSYFISSFILYILVLGVFPKTLIDFLHSESFQKIYPLNSHEINCTAQLLALSLTSIVLLSFSTIVDDRRAIWGKHGFKKSIQLLFQGCLIAIILYPVVMVVVEAAYAITDLIGKFPRGEQLVVQKLKSMRDTPWLFWSMITLSVTLVPLAEEILFRGFLQNFLFKFFGKRFSIILASLIFAFFHYSATQGATNIDLFAGLFLFSYALGVTYFKTGSLFSCIGMHAAFNAISLIIFIFFANIIK